MKKLFINLKNYKVKTCHPIHYKIDDLCPDCKTNLRVSSLNPVGEAWCPKCREVKFIN